MKVIWRIGFLTVLSSFLTGCYTQFAVLNSAPPPTPHIVIDSITGDTVRVIRQVDTIRTTERETCVWEQDVFGNPHLRCYDSYYPRDWLLYNNSPWWYRQDPFWYDYQRCPRYYYYDPSCGCCRYYRDDLSNGGGGDKPTEPRKSPAPSRSSRTGPTAQSIPNTPAPKSIPPQGNLIAPSLPPQPAAQSPVLTKEQNGNTSDTTKTPVLQTPSRRGSRSR